MNFSVDNLEPRLIEAFRSFRKSHLSSNSATQDDRLRERHETTIVDDLEAALNLWDGFHLQLLSSQAQSDFETALQGGQYESYKAIQDFFDGRWHDDPNPRDTMRSASHIESALFTTANGPYVLTYAQIVYAAFVFEMNVMNFSSHNLVAPIHLRSKLVDYVSAQRMAYSCLCSCRQASGVPVKDQHGNSPGYFLRRIDDPQSKGLRLPYYLWDRTQRRTVVVHDLTFRPRYMCISHTWGKWAAEDSFRLEGVPWLAPTNSRFEICEMASILADADLPTQYVWIDLVCIPRGVYDTKRQAQEIAKQADIFENAVACVAWLNDVKAWDRLLPSIKWMGLFYLRKHSGSMFPEVEQYLQQLDIDANDASGLFQKIHFPLKESSENEWFTRRSIWDPTGEAASVHTDLCCSRPLEQCPDGQRLCAARGSAAQSEIGFAKRNALPGFPDRISSLWTLQEACLWPQMSLASRSFTPLTTGLDMHVTLDSLVTLAHSLDRSTSRRGPTAIRTYFSRQFSTLGPIEVILMSNERQCSGQRTPAIMSVLGVTSWYEKQIASDHQTPGEGQLIWDKYPLDFVHEAAAKIGPLFFATSPMDCTNGSPGAMLPFSQGEDTRKIFSFAYPTPREDAQHEPWQILNEGYVYIQSAVIVAAGQSSEPIAAHQRYGRSKRISAEVVGLPGYPGSDTDLQELLDALVNRIDHGDSYSFAVHLAQDSWRQFGIILAGSRSDEVEGTKVLRKMGAYYIDHSLEQVYQIYEHRRLPRLPMAQAVRWLAI
ncbi:hypothetical protein H2200_012845 [Cladophialophora chaetospira]|uniref:Heterokaryon incompatibility domain-containing protein n=1 Tax=Cladophialophora chaetospira TaxID=386627 RepID=A0AA38WWZ5_9EURO|nr:hypothetical protein H2200_012845 [Cladophialophora chaetospira]